MTRQFQPRLLTGENLTEAAKIADSQKGYCEDLYCDEEGKGIEQEYWAQEPPPLGRWGSLQCVKDLLWLA